MPPEIRNVDDKGRLMLPKSFANELVKIEVVNDNELKIYKVVAVPKSIYANTVQISQPANSVSVEVSLDSEVQEPLQSNTVQHTVGSSDSEILVKKLAKYGDCELFRWFGYHGYDVQGTNDFVISVLGRDPAYPTVQTQVSVGRTAGDDLMTKRGAVPKLPNELEQELKSRIEKFSEIGQ